MRVIFFDYNSTTKLAPEALAKMNEAYQLPLNSSSIHQLGRKAASMVEAARAELKNLLNAQNYEVISTSSAAEASNTVIFGVDVKKILFSAIEHSSVFNCRPENKEIIEIAALESGLIDINDLEKKLESIASTSFLVSIMLANNETGAIQPIAEIAKLVHQKGGLLHCDIVQAVGKIEVDLEKLNVDFASVSAYKFNGPQGVGALLMRKGLDIKPLIYGGKQEKSKRAGSLNIAGIVGLGEACKLARKKISNHEKTRHLRDFLESEIKKICGENFSKNVKIFSSQVVRIPNTSYIALRNVDSQTQLINFDLNGICVSTGPACSSGTTQVSRVLSAMKIDPEFAGSAIRISLDVENTQDEIEKFIKIWGDFYQKKFT
ncbi:MAG: cysteine desulfurase family protein [Rickettsiales bacterium]|nr:cysteine desulfurase family protein [Rickettsiales bacterium]